MDEFSGNAFAAILDNTTWNFPTVAVDATAPVLTLQSPADEATNLPTTTSIVATFDESVLPDTGNITIVDVSSGTDTRVISVTDASQVSFAGSVMTVTPSSPLQLGKNYAVQIAATAVKNFNNLNYAGIADTTSRIA